MQTYHLISKINKIENSSDPDDSYIYTVSNKNEVSSKNIIKLRIFYIDFQIDSVALVNVR